MFPRWSVAATMLHRHCRKEGGGENALGMRLEGRLGMRLEGRLGMRSEDYGYEAEGRLEMGL